MTAYRIFGSEMSPYSVKVRSYFRYKAIPHAWIVRNAGNMEEYDRYAKLPLIPLVVSPDGKALQDSTPILEAMEALFPEPSIHPQDPTLRFLSALIEEFGDEWGVKWMFHYRWTYEADQASGAERIARENFPGAGGEELGNAVAMIRGRMVPRLKFVGSSDATREMIEACFKRALAILETHFTTGRKYLLGNRPAFADFGLWGQMYELSTDPTPGAIMRRMAPNVLAWIERMLAPKDEGPFEPWRELSDTLSDLLRDEVGRYFLPWSDANARAAAAGASESAADLPGGRWTQEPQKYAVKSLAALRARYEAAPEKGILDAILKDTGCLSWLQG